MGVSFPQQLPMRVLVCFLSLQAQWKYTGTGRGHILLSRPRHSPVFGPATGTRDRALCRHPGQSCCFSLFRVTVSRLCGAGTVSLYTVQMGLGFSAVGVCIFLKWGLSPSFIPWPLFTAPRGCLFRGSPARELIFPVCPLPPVENSHSHRAQASYK